MKNGVYLSKCGTMFCVLDADEKEKRLSYNVEAFPMNMAKLRKWIYLGEL